MRQGRNDACEIYFQIFSLSSNNVRLLQRQVRSDEVQQRWEASVREHVSDTIVNQINRKIIVRQEFKDTAE